MPVREFTGFAGLPLVADTYGHDDHPSVLLIPGATQSRKIWRNAAKALAAAGRYVVCVDLRGHGESGRPGDGNYQLDAFIADLVAILAQMSTRPVIIGSTFGGWIALTALGEASAPLATGLVITNPPSDVAEISARAMSAEVQERVSENTENNEFDQGVFEGGFNFKDLENRMSGSAGKLRIPTMIVRGEQNELSSAKSSRALADLIPNVELKEIEGGGHYLAFDNADEFNAMLLEFLERQIPRNEPEFVSGSDQRTLRDAMGCFATGITVIATRNQQDEPVGLTANSFSSVSLDPPLVLVCLAKSAGSLAAFQNNSAFAVNILHMGQQPVSNLFASKGKDRFAETDWETWDHDVPIISNSLANFECIKKNEIEQGDHIILIGEVVRAKIHRHRDPLLYYGGHYRRLHLG